MILLLGGSGMLGRAWIERLTANKTTFESVGRAQVDLSRPESLDEVAWDDVSAVVNCAAWTDVDGAETSEADATLINGTAVAALAQRCAAEGVPLVHYSTDYVFAGDASEPYPVDGPLAPLNAYGRSKAVGEQGIRDAGGPHLILRTSWLYAPWGRNFVLTMAKLGAERETLNVVDDQRGRPSSSQHVAEVSHRLLEQRETGTFHVTDGGACTWHEFATEIVAAVNPKCRVEPCSSDAFVRPAKRPAYSVLDLGPTEARVGVMPDWRENLRAVLAQR